MPKKKYVIAALVFVLSVAVVFVVPRWKNSADFEEGYTAIKKGDLGTGLRKIQPLADHGYAEAQLLLGLMYSHGKGKPKDVKKGIQWITKAAEQGNEEAQYRLGAIFRNDEVYHDNKKSIKWFIKAAEQGNAEAQYFLGDEYYWGYSVDQNYEKAVEWLTKASKQTNAGAQFTLGLAYYNGNGVPKDYQKAITLWKKSAGNGLANAKMFLGNIYAEGDGTPVDHKEAFRWFEKAAKQGYAAGQFSLGECYYWGKGVKQNYDKAISLYKQAADQGDVEAQVRLGGIYLRGEGVSQDNQEALKWFLKADKKMDDKEAEFYLGTMYAEGKGVPENQTEAVKWFNKSAIQNYPDALYELGRRYDEGAGVPQDNEKSMSLIFNAAERGQAEAQKIVSSMNQTQEDHNALSSCNELKENISISTKERTYGPYKISITLPQEDENIDIDGCLKIQNIKTNEIINKIEVEPSQAFSDIDSIVVDRPDRFPYMVIHRRSGGAHCCNYYDFYSLDENSLGKVAELDNAHSTIKIEDSDSDGTFDVVARDWTFAYWKTSFAGSPAPETVIDITDWGWKVAAEKMKKPPPPLDDLISLANKVKKDDIWTELRGKYSSDTINLPSELLGTLLDLLYTGNPLAANLFIENAWPSNISGKSLFIKDFIDQLKTSQYWGNWIEEYTTQLLASFPKTEDDGSGNYWTYKEWNTESYDSLVSYSTHGTVAWGHEFGFIKKPSNCDNDILFLSWSTQDVEIKKFINDEFTLRMSVGGKSFDIQTSLTAANSDLLNSSTLMAFTNFMAGQKFIELLSLGENITVGIIGPKNTLKHLDIKEDTFHLSGFIANRLKAQEMCHSLSN